MMPNVLRKLNHGKKFSGYLLVMSSPTFLKWTPTCLDNKFLIPFHLSEIWEKFGRFIHSSDIFPDNHNKKFTLCRNPLLRLKERARRVGEINGFGCKVENLREEEKRKDYLRCFTLECLQLFRCCASSLCAVKITNLIHLQLTFSSYSLC